VLTVPFFAGVCCPGGLYTAYGFEEWEWSRMFSAGHGCGTTPKPIVHNMPTGIVRASLGGMSTEQDVETFITFLHDTFVVDEVAIRRQEAPKTLFVEEGVFEIPFRAQPPIPMQMDAVIAGH
jgi:hypothetical protein